MTTTTTRTAIVTGGARGIGAGVSQRLAADGFAVAVLDLDEAACKAVVAEIEAAGGRALAVGADVADEEAVQAAVERVVAELGEPTVLVNNAGIIRDNRVEDITDDDWHAVVDVSLTGSFPCARRLRPHEAPRLRTRDQPRLDVLARHLRPVQLRRRQGRHRGADPHPRSRRRAPRHHR